jgi:hypothetical protein
MLYRPCGLFTVRMDGKQSTADGRLFDVGGQDLKSALRQAQELVAFAEQTLQG